MVSTHHAHMNSVGLYRLGQPCYRELLRRMAAEWSLSPHDVSTHLFLHDPRNFHIFQQVAHRFLYTDLVQNRLDEWDLESIRKVSADTAFCARKALCRQRAQPAWHCELIKFLHLRIRCSVVFDLYLVTRCGWSYGRSVVDDERLRQN